ncbi:MAG: alanine racemase [Lachnospiraceae bacterium]|nr:alanine racemase [Lachnospiraceae bacterium]
MTDDKIKALLATETTPLYVYDTAVLKNRVAYLKAQLPERVSLCYAMKANAFIIKALEGQVDYFEICSPGEYRICENVGLPRESYVISGVNKSQALIEELVNGETLPNCLTVESLHHFHMIREAAHKARRRVPVLLRVTTSSQFGLDKADLCSLVAEYQADEWLDIVGIQHFSGTQKTSLKKVARELKSVDALIRELAEDYHFEVKKLEYGGGFPVAYFEGETFDEEAYLAGFSDLLSEMSYQGPIVLELGRSIAASCGTYLTGVVDVKYNDGVHYAIVDGGMHQMNYFGQFMAMKMPAMHLVGAKKRLADADNAADPDNAGLEAGSDGTDTRQPWHICGSLCTTNDILVKQAMLPDLAIGDVLAFENTGAYSVTEGMALFLSRDLPAVILANENGVFKKVRDHIEIADLNTPQL